MLREVGYSTAGIGKWHLGLGISEKTDYAEPLRPGPATLGFDYYFGIPASLDMEPYLYFEDDHSVQLPTETIEASAHRRQDGGGFWRAGPVAPDFRHIEVLPTITQKAVDYIRARKGDPPGNPFFLYVALSAPHTPWLPEDEFRGRSGAGYYGDFCVQVDSTVGQIVEALESLDQGENTLIVYTSDNGAHWPRDDTERFDHAANLDYRGQKADIWEGGHRVPFIVRWPDRVPRGTTSDQTICLTDLYATIASIVEIEMGPKEGEDSVDLLPVWRGEQGDAPIREAVVHHSNDGMFAIRKGKWKLILGRGSGGFTAPTRIEPALGEPEGQLYDLDEDRSEERNLYLDYPEIVDELKTLLAAYRKEGRSTPLTGGERKLEQ
jgi:arylsulfatase A-like enzyme